MGALEGIRVIEMADMQVAAAGYIFGDLGADVIKVEDTVRGDSIRGYSRMFGDPAVLPGGRHAAFETTGRSKRGITLNLEHPRGREIFYRLVEKSDIFFTNFGEERLRRQGADYETLSRRKPTIIYGCSSGFGPVGPDAGRRAYDFLGQARAGLMWAMSDRDYPEPTIAIGGIADTMAATMLVLGGLAALAARDRQGIGQRYDASLYGDMIHLTSLGVGLASLVHMKESRHSRKRARNPMSNFYRCADDNWILFTELQSDRYWQEFCEALGVQHILSDPRFATSEDRRKNYTEINTILEKILGSKTRQEWLDIFRQRRVRFAYSPVFHYDEVLDDPQALENDYIAYYDHPIHGRVKVPGFPLRFSKTPACIQREAPEWGQHTEEVLSEICGLSWEEMAKLSEEKVI